MPQNLYGHHLSFQFYCTDIHSPRLNVWGIFLIAPFPFFALVHAFFPTIPPCLNNFHDPAICFASRVWGMSTECGETCLDVKTLAHSTSKALPLFYFSLGCAARCCLTHCMFPLEVLVTCFLFPLLPALIILHIHI